MITTAQLALKCEREEVEAYEATISCLQTMDLDEDERPTAEVQERKGDVLPLQ